ncbi:MAG: N-6 DNA methylase [Chloroflexota bacterium]
MVRSTLQEFLQSLAPHHEDGLDDLYAASIQLTLQLLVTAVAEQRGAPGIPAPPAPVDPHHRQTELGVRAGNVEGLRARISVLASRPGAPDEILSSAYETLLALHPVFDPKCGIKLRAHAAGRRARGAFYTPPWLARLVVEETLSCSPLPVMPRILDPAMGTGVFLTQAALALSSRCDADPAAIAERCLFGIDNDPLSVWLAIAGIALRTGGRWNLLAEHLWCRDALDPAPPPGAPFDLVAGNPPWGARISIADPATKRCPGLSDSFKAFLGRACQLTGGPVGMVVPQAMLAQTGHADVRAQLLADRAPATVIDLGNGHFRGVAAPGCVLVFRPRPGPAHIRVLEPRSGTTRSVPAHRWSAHGFSLGCEEELQLLRRLQRAHGTLGEISRHFRIRDAGLNYNRAGIARRALYDADQPRHPLDIPVFRGRNFQRYSSVERGSWLAHTAPSTLLPGEHLSMNPDLQARPEKIVLRQTADTLIATIDRSQMLMGRSVIAITPESCASLHALLACLNSRLLTLLYRALAGEEGRILPQVKVARLASLPMPEPHGSIAWGQLHALCRRRLAARSPAPELESKIDAAVYRLFALTEREIAWVES